MRQFFFICAVFILGTCWIQPAKAAPSSSVYFLPHQDDEMFLLGAIIKDLEAHRPVYVVMTTDGNASRVKELLKLNSHEFTRARNSEFYQSMRAAGVPASHILFANPGGVDGSDAPLYKDGSLTVTQATQVIEKYYQYFGNEATYSTVRANGNHPDHRALHEALRAFQPIAQKYFYSEVGGEGRVVVLSKDEQIIKKKALQRYSVWAPSKKRWAIGRHSVHDILTFWAHEPAEYLFNE